MKLSNLLWLGIVVLTMASMPAAAEVLTFSPTTATFLPSSGMSINSTSDTGGVLDFSHSYASLTNTGDMGIGSTVYVLLGTLTFKEGNVNPSEVSNLQPFIVGFQFAGYDAFSIATTSMSASSSADTATAVFSTAYQYVDPIGPPTNPTVGARISFSNTANDPDWTWSSSGGVANLYVQVQYLNGEADVHTPEPQTFVLLGSALVGLGLLRRRKRA